MPEQAEHPKIALSEPDDWLEFRYNGTVFYADSRIHPVRTRIYEASLLLDSLGMWGPTDREWNIMASQNPGIAEQMREYFIFTGVLRNVRAGWRGRYKASYIESPEIRINPGDRPLISGSEKRITLPPQGWFKIEELLRSGTGLPQRTYRKLPDEPCAYFMVRDGQEMALLRGRNYSERGCESREFAVTVYYKPVAAISNLGILAVSDEDPRPKESQPEE